MEYYYKVVLKSVPREAEDLLTLHCFESGASGVAEDLKFKQSQHDYKPRTVQSAVFVMNAFFEKEIPESFFDGITERFSRVQVEVLQEPHRDWLEEWKKDFKAFSLVDDVWVVPSWLEVPAEAKVPLSIDPGMAFGTGTHGTTQIAAQFLKQLMAKSPSGISVLDVGTGTGVLAILARKLGAQRCICTEIDEVARDVARENVKRNECDNVIVVNEQVEDLVDRSQVVIANIIDGVLVQIQDHLKRLCQPEGHLILTGVLREREKSFRKKFGLNDDTLFEVVERLEKDDWVGFLVRRKK